MRVVKPKPNQLLSPLFFFSLAGFRAALFWVVLSRRNVWAHRSIKEFFIVDILWRLRTIIKENVLLANMRKWYLENLENPSCTFWRMFFTCSRESLVQFTPAQNKIKTRFSLIRKRILCQGFRCYHYQYWIERAILSKACRLTYVRNGNLLTIVVSSRGAVKPASPKKYK